MNGLTKAMMLASLPLCALVAACGGGSDDPAPTHSPTQVTTDALLGDIQPELNEARITILDSEPDEEPALSLQDASEILNEHGAKVTRGALLRMDSYIDTLYLAPETYPKSSSGPSKWTSPPTTTKASSPTTHRTQSSSSALTTAPSSPCGSAN